MSSFDARGLPDTIAPGGQADGPGLLAGAVIGRFQIERMLGRGGAGEVYLARDLELDRPVALKLLRGDAVATAARARFLREARSLARIAHPNVVRIYDVGVHEGRIFLAIEYLSGSTLASYLATAPRGWHEIIQLLAEAGRGIAAIHAAGLVHRDVKPCNILVGDDGRVSVLDLGVAGAPETAGDGAAAPAAPASSDDIVRALTVTGTVLGTPGFMAPEQELGRAEARSDVYSLCATAWMAFYGAPPRLGPDGRPLPPRAAAAGARAAPHVPAWVRAVIARGLSADPARRHASMDALVRALVGRPRRSRRASAALGAALAVAGATAVASAVLDARGGVAAAGQLACRLEAGELDRVWSPEARALIASRGIRGGGADAAGADLIVASIDALVADLRRELGGSCAAWRAARPPAAELEAARVACLRGARWELAAFVDAHRGDARPIDPSELSYLTPAAACREAGEVALAGAADAAAGAPPGRAALAAALSEHFAGGRPRDVEAAAAGVVAAAARSGDHATAARGLEVVGMMALAQEDRPGRAMAMLERAFSAVEQASDDFAAMRIAAKLATVAGTHHLAAEASAWLSVARAKQVRVGDPPAARLAVHVAASVVAHLAGRYRDALAHSAERVALARALFGAASARYCYAIQGRFEILVDAGELAEAARLEGEDRGCSARGTPAHRVERALAHGEVLERLGDPAAAIQRYRDALAFASDPAAPALRAGALARLARAVASGGDPREALELADAGLRLVAPGSGARGTHGELLLARGVALARLGRGAEARADCEDAAALLEEAAPGRLAAALVEEARRCGRSGPGARRVLSSRFRMPRAEAVRRRALARRARRATRRGGRGYGSGGRGRATARRRAGSKRDRVGPRRDRRVRPRRGGARGVGGARWCTAACSRASRQRIGGERIGGGERRG